MERTQLGLYDTRRIGVDCDIIFSKFKSLARFSDRSQPRMSLLTSGLRQSADSELASAVGSS
jgi:hypothetical protein